MSLVIEDAEFQLILRVLNTNVKGTDKVMYALTKIKGIGRRFSNLIVKKADIDLNKRSAAAAALFPSSPLPLLPARLCSAPPAVH
jgi:hypothetical protein